MTCSWDGTAQVWDAHSGEERFRLPYDDFVEAAQWNANESLILISSSDKTARVWDAQM